MAVIDIESLLNPISDAQPGGSDQSSSAQYLQIIESMREDDPNVSLQSWEEARVADWGKVERLCEELLANKTKDLNVVMWFTDALLHRHGIQGLNDGITLAACLCRDYWDFIIPMLEDPNDLYRRMNAILKFTNKFSEKIRLINITQPSAQELHGYNWGHYSEASYVDKLPPADQQTAVQQYRATTALFNASLQSSPNSFYLELNAQVDELKALITDFENILIERCEALRESLDEKSDADFSFGNAYEAIDLLKQFTKRIVSERGLDKVEEVHEEVFTTPVMSDDGTMVMSMGSGGGGNFDAIQNREDAYRNLEKVANALMKIEPHSPVPYLLKRALKWGRMNAQEMFTELYSNAGDLNQLFRLLDMGQGYGGMGGAMGSNMGGGMAADSYTNEPVSYSAPAAPMQQDTASSGW